ncbi:MAG: NERD domain-containing protein [Thermoplasmata archaeon]
MVVKYFCGSEFSGNELDQFKSIKNILERKYKNDNDFVYVIFNFHLPETGTQIDILIIKNFQNFLIIEMKNYQGDIYGSTNGVWKAIDINGNVIEIKEGYSGNLFLQCKLERSNFVKFLENLHKKNENILNNLPFLPSQDLSYKKDNPIYKIVSSWLFFKDGSQYKGGVENSSPINFGLNPWFNVTNENNLFYFLDKLKNNYEIKKEDLNEIIKSLNVRECSENLNQIKTGSEISKILIKFADDYITLDFLYQFASLPTKDKEKKLEIDEYLNYIENNLKIRYGDVISIETENLLKIFNSEIKPIILKKINIAKRNTLDTGKEKINNVIKQLENEIIEFIKGQRVLEIINEKNRGNLSYLERLLLRKIINLSLENNEFNIPRVKFLLGNDETDVTKYIEDLLIKLGYFNKLKRLDDDPKEILVPTYLIDMII